MLFNSLLLRHDGMTTWLFRAIGIESREHQKEVVDTMRNTIGTTPMSFSTNLAVTNTFNTGNLGDALTFHKHGTCNYPQRINKHTIVFICTGFDYIWVPDLNPFNSSEQEAWPWRDLETTLADQVQNTEDFDAIMLTAQHLPIGAQNRDTLLRNLKMNQQRLTEKGHTTQYVILTANKKAA